MHRITDEHKIAMFLNGKAVRCDWCGRTHKAFTKKWDREHGEYLSCRRRRSYPQSPEKKRNTGIIIDIKAYLKRCESRAIKKNMSMTITEADIEQLLTKQDGRCAISGESFADKKWSIDRIDSSKGYIKTNIQLVTIRVNVMKSNMNKYDFIDQCGVIWNNSKHLLAERDKMLAYQKELDKACIAAANTLSPLLKQAHTRDHPGGD